MVFEFINYTTITNRDLILYQLFYNELKPVITFYKLDLKIYKVIELYYKVFILLEKQPKAYKVKVKIESRKFLIVLRSKTYLIYVFIKNIMIKMSFIKLYKYKNPLTLKEVSKLIEIRLLNDVAITKDSIGKRVSLDLLEIDNISSSKPTTSKAPRSFKPPKLPAPKPSKPPEPKNKPSKPIFSVKVLR